MPGPWDFTPNRGLQTASVIAQGLSSGFSAYEAKSKSNEEMAMKAEQMKAQADLNRLKMQKLQQEIAPVSFSAQKYKVFADAADAGMIPESMKNSAAKDLYENATTPAQIAFLGNMVDRKKQSEMQKMNPLDLSMSMGGGMSDVMTAQQPKPYMGDMQAPAPRMQAPQAAPPQDLSLTPNEAKLYGNTYKASKTAGVGFAGVNQRGDAATLQHQAKLSEIQGKMQTAADQNEREYWKTQYLDETNRYLGDNKNATSIKVAEIGANSRVAASKNRVAGSRASANPEQKLLADLIKQKEKAVSDLQKPATGLNMELPSEKAVRIQAAQADLGKAYDQYKQKFGTDFRVSAPAAPAVKAPGGKSKPVVISGDAASVKTQAKAMKDGVPYQVGQMSFVNEGGVPKAYVQQGN